MRKINIFLLIVFCVFLFGSGGVVGYYLKNQTLINIGNINWALFNPSFLIIIGFSVGIISDLIKSNNQLSNKTREMIYIKRLDKVEQIIELVNKTILSKSIEIREETPKTCRNIFCSKEALGEISSEFNEFFSKSNIWLSTNLNNIIGELNRYLHAINRHVIINHLSDKELIKIGCEINDDLNSILTKVYKELRSYLNKIPKKELLENVGPYHHSYEKHQYIKDTVLFTEILDKDLVNLFMKNKEEM